MKKVLFGLMLMLITSIASSATITQFYRAGNPLTNPVPTASFSGSQTSFQTAEDYYLQVSQWTPAFDYWKVFVGSGDTVTMIFDNAYVPGFQNVASPLQAGGFENLTSNGQWRTFQVARGGGLLDPAAMNSPWYSYTVTTIVNGVDPRPAPPVEPPPVTTVPEPTTLFMFAIALIGFSVYKKRQNG